MFFETDMQGAINVCRLLRCFELASDLRINFQKSCVHSVGVSDDVGKNISNILHCEMGSLPFNYLCIPLGANLQRIST